MTSWIIGTDGGHCICCAAHVRSPCAMAAWWKMMHLLVPSLVPSNWKKWTGLSKNNLEGLMYYDVFSNLTFLLVPYCTQHKATNRHVNHHPSLTSRLRTTVLKGRPCVLLRPRCKVAFDGSLLHGCPARFAPKAERQQTGCVFCWSSLSCVEKFMCVYSRTDWCVCVSENGVCSQMPSNAFKCLFSSIFNIFSPHLCVRFLFFCCALPSADQLLRPPSVRRPPRPALFHTHNFVAQLSHTQLFHTQLFHTQLFHIHTKIFHGTWWHRRHFCVAGVALSDMDSAFVWQAWHLRHVTFAWQHLMTSMSLLCGRHGTFWDGRCFCVAGVGTGLALVAGLVAGTVVFCVAGVALDDIDVTFVWQMWHLLQTVRFHDGLHGLSGDICSWCQNMPLPPLPTTEFHGVGTTRFGTTLSHPKLLSHTTLGPSHTTLSHATLPHPRPSHTSLSQYNFSTSFPGNSHIQLFTDSSFHLPSFTPSSFTSHTMLFHTHTHLCHPQRFHRQLLHMHLFPRQLFHMHLFHTPNLSHATLPPTAPHQILHIQVLHQQLFHAHTTTNNSFTYNSSKQSILHHLLCVSCLSRPASTACLQVLEEIDMLGFPVL